MARQPACPVCGVPFFVSGAGGYSSSGQASTVWAPACLCQGLLQAVLQADADLLRARADLLKARAESLRADWSQANPTPAGD